MRWLRRRSARLRLTLLYSALFLVLGTATLVLTNVLANHQGQVAQAVPTHQDAIVPSAGPAALAPALQKQLVSVSSGDRARLLGASWIALALAALLSALLGWVAAGRVLRPLRTITATAQTISAGNLDQRLALDGPQDEFKALGDTLDQLFARLEASFNAQRRFVANASHELRTPLALERTLLEVALADPGANAGTLRATCKELLAANAEQAELLEALLTLASSERGLDRHDPIELSLICAELADAAAPRAHELSIHLTTDLASAHTSGDPALLRRLVSNLLSNALQYNHPEGTVHLRTWVQDGRSCLSVTNSGAIIANHAIARLFQPFQRLDKERTISDSQGHGLGLSIVRAIVDAHGATLAASPNNEGGLTVTVTFPTQPIEHAQASPPTQARSQ